MPVRVERVVEVTFGQLENGRFRHGVTFLRWRPDRTPESCRYDQLDVASPVDFRQFMASSQALTPTARATPCQRLDAVSVHGSPDGGGLALGRLGRRWRRRRRRGRREVGDVGRGRVGHVAVLVARSSTLALIPVTVPCGVVADTWMRHVPATSSGMPPPSAERATPAPVRAMRLDDDRHARRPGRREERHEQLRQPGLRGVRRRPRAR